MSISQIMSTPVVSVEPDDPLWTVNDIFQNSRFHHLLVVENKKLCGVLSDRDLLRALSPKVGTMAETKADLATLNKRVHQVMTRKPIFLHKDDSIFKAIDIFESHSISCIPVVDDRQVPIGIVSWRDLLKAVNRKDKVE